MDINELEALLNELFVQNTVHFQRETLTPLNIEHSCALKDKAKTERELYDSLVLVAQLIDQNGGISEQTYETHKYAINSIARDLTNLRWWGSNQTVRCEQEDREGKKTDSKKAELKDKRYSEEENINIFGSQKEGTLFYREFENGTLIYFRIFHQGHRASLDVKTVNIPELIEKIKDYVANYKPEIDLGFTVGKEEYLAKIAEFNQEFGEYVQLKILGKNTESIVVAYFKETPHELANKLREIAESAGQKAIMDEWGEDRTFNLNGRTADLFLASDIEREYHEKIQEGKSTIILPFKYPEASNPLIQMYLSAHMVDAGR